jgi:AhpD family alkylhydroperoxidase
MNKKTEEMIALGAAYAVNCQPCLEFHKQKSTEAGVTRRKECKRRSA